MNSQQLADGLFSNRLHTKLLSLETEQIVLRERDHRDRGLGYHETENLESKMTTPEFLWLFIAEMKAAKAA